MSQCVPSWDLDDVAAAPISSSSSRLTLRPLPICSSLATPEAPTLLDYEVAELTWENGQLSLHGLGLPRVPNKSQLLTASPTKCTWDKPRAGGTLESIVNQATRPGTNADEFLPWFQNHREFVAGAAVAVAVDALVPGSDSTNGNDRCEGRSAHEAAGIGTCVVGSATHVGSCSGGGTAAACAGGVEAPVPEWRRSSKAADQSGVSGTGSATCGMDSHNQVIIETYERELKAGGFASTSMGSLENTSSGKQCTKTSTADDHDSVSRHQLQREAREDEDMFKTTTAKSSVSTKRSRAAAIHNQSERKRRDKINQKMKTLQKMVPNANKTDKASMLDEVIEYLKQLQAQVQMMNRMTISPMMLQLPLQQQLQVSMMGPMGMGLAPVGMGTSVVDMNAIGRSNVAGISPVIHHHPTTFMPMASWDGSSTDRATAPATDPLSAFLTCQSPPITMEAYSRMAALYQQLHQAASSVPGSKI